MWKRDISERARRCGGETSTSEPSLRPVSFCDSTWITGYQEAIPSQKARLGHSGLLSPGLSANRTCSFSTHMDGNRVYQDLGAGVDLWLPSKGVESTLHIFTGAGARRIDNACRVVQSNGNIDDRIRT
jgi:hypothetical protein